MVEKPPRLGILDVSETDPDEIGCDGSFRCRQLLRPGQSLVGRKKEQNAEGLNTIHGARVLLVEDNEINQQVALEILQEAGLTVEVAGNGREAVEAVKKNKYDAVLMDIQMPVMNGYTATEEIRKWEDKLKAQSK